MTRPDVPDLARAGLAILGLLSFVGILECWHQFRAHDGWVSSGWFAAMILSFTISLFVNRSIANRH